MMVILGRSLFFLAFGIVLFSFPVQAMQSPPSWTKEETCRSISGRLASVGLRDCLEGGLISSGWHSVNNVPILVKEYPPLETRQPQSRVLVVGGTHGDEYSSISIVFKWMQILDIHHSGLFHWIFIPLLNPDGLFSDGATRTNASGVDINRNFPGPLWREVGYDRWKTYTNENPRYYPGPYPMSEPETGFLVHLIREFRPDAIISVHSPLDLVDYDGPGRPPSSIGGLGLRRLGNFPGTLGNFAGIQLGIPVVTLELASSVRMPGDGEISSMWRDLVRWLINNTPVRKDPGQLQAVDDLELQKEFFGK
ncbi:M14 family murein peptide amidase A [Desulfonatronovibrio hydrogenovorans]|uniref:M14 family murein peptide amidase A n=1 Tax=Desulfonatronovibrio hydrogenovorans TaxID=53245 RepID=UPI00055285F5|nr:M14 family murein peptide amidase A [Desulfonatronovibrio hydrogenovorans]